jgi:replicative DNA helicase
VALRDNDILFAFDGFAITNEDFYNKEHQLIWQAIETLWMNRKVIDVLTLSDQLTKL